MARCRTAVHGEQHGGVSCDPACRSRLCVAARTSACGTSPQRFVAPPAARDRRLAQCVAAHRAGATGFTRLAGRAALEAFTGTDAAGVGRTLQGVAHRPDCARLGQERFAHGALPHGSAHDGWNRETFDEADIVGITRGVLQVMAAASPDGANSAASPGGLSKLDLMVIASMAESPHLLTMASYRARRTRAPRRSTAAGAPSHPGVFRRSSGCRYVFAETESA